MNRAHATLPAVLTVLALAPTPVRQQPWQASERALPNDNRVPAGELHEGVLALRLEARAAAWYPEDSAGPAVPVYAFAEAGRPVTIPGPLIRVRLGTMLQVTVHNTLDRPMTLRGLQAREGIAEFDSLLLAPGARQRISFRADRPGTYYYWGRTEPIPALPIVGRGRDASLIGAFIVDPPNAPVLPDERILVMTMWEDTAAALGTKSDLADLVLRREYVRRDEWLLFGVNGRSWPQTERLTYTVGDTVRWRVINGAFFPHPMHLHGFHYTVTARGTAVRDTLYRANQYRTVVTEWMPRGTTMRMTWLPTRQGNWLFHCHFVTHISEYNRISTPNGRPSFGHSRHAEQGMAGLVVGVQVAPRPGAPEPRDVAERRRLRLFITERANVFGEHPGYSYVLQDGPAPPAADSIQGVGSTLVLRRNEPTEITVTNLTRSTTSIHWHGIELESFFDGVGDWSGWGTRVAPPIAPGDSFVVRITPPRAGTFIYHTHVAEGVALASGLYGALVVLPEQTPADEAGPVVLVSDGGPHDEAPTLVNGSLTPGPILLQAGRPHRLRLISISPLLSSIIQLQSGDTVLQWRALAKDGADRPAGQALLRAARVELHPGETYDFEVLRARPESLRLTISTLPSTAERLAARAAGIPGTQLRRIVTAIPVVVR